MNQFYKNYTLIFEKIEGVYYHRLYCKNKGKNVKIEHKKDGSKEDANNEIKAINKFYRTEFKPLKTQ